ncbi:MAG TPA: type II toxin-antitoxin system VapC family toxin [Blastocatellia bacterium]|nr:type II toxin-antitoxin system VapC family toxin [Blastocatellia bacterium]HMV82841.1 type II toxin-antitoxin system VapC family toxin [Blastocatellia bacterium]HMX25825.1 type II toxin-antitoxin system VapC family toxin [Blastocatellia bacterium]HMY71882.1 type II toxin-antitoxin system VapC family toxin [Blastocatellia bacterium]HMZ18783.1 type II toxin-antitoxin system VapC family toxin [Blastocatellia bacterium]
MSQSSSFGAVVIDANILISICSNEPSSSTAETALAGYANQNWSFYAPNVIVAESLYALRQKLRQGVLTQTEYDLAVEALKRQMAAILPPPNGEAALLQRAKEIQAGYGCSHSADCLYIALAEELVKLQATELLTFDAGTINQAAKNAPSVVINLLPV